MRPPSADDALSIRRTHDRDIYLEEERFDEPKEIFKLLGRLAAESGRLRPGARVADIGCATGEFLYYLSRTYPGAEYVGVDPVGDLIDVARTRVADVRFERGSVLNENLFEQQSLDVAFYVAVHAMFDDVRPGFANVLRWTKPGGRAYVFGPFNPHPVDVWVTYRRLDDPDPAHREPGWNMVAKESVSSWLSEQGREHRFLPFELPFDLEPHPDDPVRTWTLTIDGRRRFTNGLSLLLSFYVLEITG